MEERDKSIIESVVIIDMKVEIGNKENVDKWMERKLLKNMIEKEEEGGDVEIKEEIKIEGKGNNSLIGGELDDGIEGDLRGNRI